MNSEIKILKPEDIKSNLVAFFKNKSVVPIVGSGFTCGLNAFKGTVPNGCEYKKYMETKLVEQDFSEEEKKEILSASFSTLCDYYEDDENIAQETRRNYLKSNFYKVTMPKEDVRSLLFNIEWPYIYTLNIDDAIENSSSFKKIILPNKEFNDEIFSEEKCIIKLHGDIGDIITYKAVEKFLLLRNMH